MSSGGYVIIGFVALFAVFMIIDKLLEKKGLAPKKEEDASQDLAQ